MTIAMIVHGGAWDIPAREQEAHRVGCRRALEAGYAQLEAGASALDAVVTAATILEDDPTFDAAVGSHLDRAGGVSLDAGIMDGVTLKVGAVAGVTRIKNPSQVVRRLLDGAHNIFVGTGAEEWAEAEGFELVVPETLIVPREQRRFEKMQANTANPPPGSDGTIGAVARDKDSNLAVLTSTGGTLYKPVGRVGDSPLPGCGYFADNELGAVSCTGHGESIIRVQLAHLGATLAGQFNGQSPFTAANSAIRRLGERVNGEGGLIMIDRAGRISFAYNTPHLARAYRHAGMTEPVVEI